MLRTILFLCLICSSSLSYAVVDHETAWSNCSAYVAAHPYANRACYDEPEIKRVAMRDWGPTSSVVGQYYYSVECLDSSKTFDTATHTCGVTCPDGSKAPTLAECPVTCNYTPNLTTVGSTQTISWQTTDTSTNTCVNNSVSCNAPLVANVEMKRCDLQCDDGSIVDVSSGQQCPPPQCVGQQTLNTATNQCEDPVCTPPQQYLDTAAHVCLNEPNCIGGQTLNTSSTPHVCEDPVCTGIQILDTTTHMCIDPPPAQCIGAQVLNSVTNTCIDPVCPSGFFLNAGKVCEQSSECPLFTQKTMVDGVLKCAATSTSTTSTTSQSPDVTESTTKTNPDGTTSTTTQTPGTTTVVVNNTDGSVTTTTTSPGKTSTTDCPDCAKESTQREIVKRLDATQGTSAAGQGTDGLWYESSGKTFESIMQTGMTGIQNTPIMSFGTGLADLSIPSGSCPSWTIPAVMGMDSIDIAPLCSDAMELAWPIVGGALKILAAFLAIRIAMSAA